jgi:hypothetical protein
MRLFANTGRFTAAQCSLCKRNTARGGSYNLQVTDYKSFRPERSVVEKSPGSKKTEKALKTGAFSMCSNLRCIPNRRPSLSRWLERLFSSI